MRRRRATTLVALALLAGAAGAARAQLQERPLAVPRVGTVRVALPAASYGARDGFAVTAPDGAPAPWHLLALDARGAHPMARVTAVETTADGWSLVLDAGPAPPAHQGVRLPLAGTGVARVTLQTSDDGKTWSDVGSASLFRLGGADELEGAGIAYPATKARYLRLRWPRAAGFPRLREARLDTVAVSSEELLLPASACSDVGARHVVCDLAALGDRPLVTLEVTLPASAGAVGWRLRAADGGRWSLLGEGSWSEAALPGARPIALGAQPGPLRLDLYGASAAPMPARVVARGLPLALEVTARASGTYALRSGAGLPRGTPESAAADVAAQWLEPGPPHAVTGPPPLATPAGAPLPDVRFARSWRVHSAARPGDVVRLPVPEEVERAARFDLGDVRLARDGKQVPYLVEEPARPQAGASWNSLVPRTLPAGRGAASGAVSAAPIALPPGRTRQLLLRTAPLPMRRPVRVVGPAHDDALGAPQATTGWSEWRCEPQPPLPCELALDLPDALQGNARVEIEDGDNAPLAALQAELGSAPRDLLFAWPGGDVTLLAGARDVAAPRYDLAEEAESLRARDAAPARLDAVAASGEARWPRWAPLAALALAAAVLLFLLARALPRTAS